MGFFFFPTNEKVCEFGMVSCSTFCNCMEMGGILFKSSPLNHDSLLS